MCRISNTLVGLFNILVILLGLASIGSALYIHFHGGNATDCQKVLMLPLLMVGIFIVVVSAMGILGSLCRMNMLQYAYLVVTVCLILGLIAFTIFAAVVTDKKVSYQISGKGYTEYKPEGFSKWMGNYVTKEKRWSKLKICLKDVRLCRNLAVRNNALNYKQWSTTQRGCCQPPATCGYIYINATFWEAPKTSPEPNNKDCKNWKNDENSKCLDCDTCKGAVLANIWDQWRNLSIINAVALVVLSVVYIMGCCAIRNNRADARRQLKEKYRGQPRP